MCFLEFSISWGRKEANKILMGLFMSSFIGTVLIFASKISAHSTLSVMFLRSNIRNSVTKIKNILLHFDGLSLKEICVRYLLPTAVERVQQRSVHDVVPCKYNADRISCIGDHP